MDEGHALQGRAHEFLQAAQEEATAGRLNVAFALARTAAELAGKSLLWRKLGSYPRRHDVGGILAEHGLLCGLEPRQTTHLLRHHTRGEYDRFEPARRGEVKEMLYVADVLVAAAHAH